MAAPEAASPVPLPKRPQRLSHAEAALDLTAFIFGDDVGQQRESFLGQVTTTVTTFGVRGSTLGGTANAATVTENLLSGIDSNDLAKSSYSSSCIDGVHSLRALRG